MPEKVRLRVAVVDDEDCVRKSIGRLLRSAGMKVTTFASGRDLLQAVRSQAFEFIVVDLHMPAMNGFEVHEELLRSGVRLPVVMITGRDRPESRAQAAAAGFVAYLPKPIDEVALLGAIAAGIDADHAAAATD